MSQGRTSSTASPAKGLQNVAALWERGGVVRVVVVAPGATASLVEAFDAESIVQARTRLTAAKVSRVVRIASGGECVAKIEKLPEATGPELDAAIDLLAEAVLPEDAPKHRRAAARVETPAGPAVLATAWHGKAPEELEGLDERWMSEPAALMLAFGGESSVSISPDRAGGSLVVVAAGASRTVLRCTRLDPVATDRWDAAVSGAAAAAGVAGMPMPTTDEVSSSASGDGLRENLSGVPRDRGWLAKYAVPAAAAAHAASGGRLAGMTGSEGAGHEPMVLRLATWLSYPGNAVALLAGSVAVMLLAPPLLAGARAGILHLRSGEYREAQTQRTELSKQAGLYQQLEETRWPMTKLWADISNATPQNVVIETMTIEREGTRGLTLRGRADSSADLVLLQRNLNSTGVFSNVQIGQSETTGASTSFTLQAAVIGPTVASRRIDDFAKETLQARLYKNGARPAPRGESEPEPADAEPMDEVAPPARGVEGAGGGRTTPTNGGVAGEQTRPVEPRGTRGSEVPAALTDEQIKAMDRTAATREWAARLSASRNAKDPADKARLTEEAAKLRARMEELNRGGGS
jgi:hypothetical protein